MRPVSLILAISLALSSLATPFPPELECTGNQVVISEKYVGEQNVKVEQVSCDSELPIQASEKLHRRDDTVNNVCAQMPECTIQCLTPRNAGPDLNDCHVIADTLRYISQASSLTNTVGTGTNNTLVMTYQTCRSFFFNAGPIPAQYCRPIWAQILDKMSPECHFRDSMFGGQCISPDQSWYIQFEHTPSS